jgi:NodT family efflux transporter outer membrane factor (OMF) lipoprotein
MLLVLPGCLPNLRRAETGPALPPDFNGASSEQSSAQLGIDEFFNDPALASVITQALACNQELKIRNQEVQIAANEVLARRGAYLPFVALRGDAGLEKPSFYTPIGAAEEQLLTPKETHFPDPMPNFLVAANFFWQVDIWRELRNARDAAVQRYYSAVERRNFFVTQLVADVADNYYGLLALDQRLLILDQIIAIQEQSLKTAESLRLAGRGTALGVQRFLAEVRKNQSEKLIVKQEIIQTENRINFLAGRYPQPVERWSGDFIDLSLHPLGVGLPAQLLLNRRDIRQAEREMAAAGLDVMVARARFFPKLDLNASIGYEAFNPRYLFNPDALVANLAGGLVAPLANRKAIQADYLSANARQLQTIYDYQRVVLNAFTEVVNQLAKAENYRQSIEIKRQQLAALQTSVEFANNLFMSARADYVDVLFAQRDLLEARTVLIETKQQQLSALVNLYQSLGGGCALTSLPPNPTGIAPLPPSPVPAEALPRTSSPTPAPAPVPAPAPAPDALPVPAAGGEATSPGGESAGHVTIGEAKNEPTAAPLAGGDPQPEAGGLLAAPTIQPPPTPVPVEETGNPFAAVVAPGTGRKEANPFEFQPDVSPTVEAGLNPDLPSAPADRTAVGDQ